MKKLNRRHELTASPSISPEHGRIGDLDIEDVSPMLGDQRFLLEKSEGPWELEEPCVPRNTVEPEEPQNPEDPEEPIWLERENTPFLFEDFND